MYHRQVDSEYGALRARFTVWLEKLIIHAQIDYLRENKQTVITISIEELLDTEIPVYSENHSFHKNDFDFEEERLAKAFYELSLMKQKILKMLFVDEEKPEFIAKKLNCSSRYVYRQRQRALDALKRKLSKGGDEQ